MPHDDRRIVPIDEAVARLVPPGDEDVHCFMNPAVNVLTGADHERVRLVAAMRAGVVEEAGPQACAIGHCLVLKDYTGPGRCLFIASTPRREVSHAD